MEEELTSGGLFAGIGGFELGFRWAGIRSLWLCERAEYPRAVLQARFPGVPLYGDVSEIDASTPRPDILAGGFPCQPISRAGRRLAFADERWLWPEFERCIRVLRPRYVVVENVPDLLYRARGFERAPVCDVLGGLAESGYDAEWDCIPAAAVGAPHLRDRVWIVAWRASGGVPDPEQLGVWEQRERERQQSGEPRPSEPGADGAAGAVADAEREQRQALRSSGGPAQLRRYAGGGGGEGDVPDAGAARCRDVEEAEEGSWGQPWRDAADPRGESGWPSCGWAPEPGVGRVADGIPDQVERLRALGNACVPQIAAAIGRWIIEHNERRGDDDD